MSGPHPDFDAATLRKTERMVGRRAVTEIVDLFLQHAPGEIEAFGAAVDGDDCAASARATHSLRASAFNVGALRLYELAGELERHALAGDAAAVATGAAELHDAFATACDRLSAYRKTLAAPRIAVIEDNPDNRVLTRALLEGTYEVVEFDNGPDALAALGPAPPALILLDISLPGLDGVEVLKRLRAIDTLQSVPVVALTAHAMADDRERLLGEGFDEYVAKPIVDERDLLGPIERLLAGG